MAAYTPVHQLILYILKATGYETYVRALPGGNQRGANLRMLVEKAMDYEKTATVDCLILSDILRAFRSMRWILEKSM